jgi:hypothetical protein
LDGRVNLFAEYLKKKLPNFKVGIEIDATTYSNFSDKNSE